jgi:hypothetical protein
LAPRSIVLDPAIGRFSIAAKLGAARRRVNFDRGRRALDEDSPQPATRTAQLSSRPPAWPEASMVAMR